MSLPTWHSLNYLLGLDIHLFIMLLSNASPIQDKMPGCKPDSTQLHDLFHKATP